MRNRLLFFVFSFVMVLLVSWASLERGLGGAKAEARVDGEPLRRINAPRFSGSENLPVSRHAVYWFGEVTSANNQAIGRVAYNDERLQVILHVIDQYLWYDRSPTAAEFSNWDSASLYLNMAGTGGTMPGAQSVRFDAQLSHHQGRADYQVAYRGDGSGWEQRDISFQTEVAWRGSGINSGDKARGWVVTFEIPFESLGLTGAPAHGKMWDLATVVYDRDNEGGGANVATWWPEYANEIEPGSWGKLHFGLPTYTPSVVTNSGSTVIRGGVNGAEVPDAHVGGHSVCASPINPQFFAQWGSLNYAGYDQINIQNQFDIADWPCFSRYYVTFPLDSVPAGKVLISATLTMFQFGNAEASADVPVAPQDSFIQVLTLADEWDEETITANNAPLPLENVSVQTVSPVPGAHAPWPGVARSWNVTRAVAQALSGNSPLRLVLFSADGAYHSGKYFHSSDADEAGRPMLQVVWGDLFEGEIKYQYVPLVMFR